MVQTIKPVGFSQTWTFFEGEWHEGNVPIMGPRTHAAWLGSSVFDGARAFEGVAPDLDLHCARVNQSAINFMSEARRRYRDLAGAGARGHRPFRGQRRALHPADVLGARRAAAAACCSIRRRRTGACASTRRRCRKPTGFAITLSPFRRPTMECAPVDAKAACLYPNNSRALIEAQSRGFDNCLVLDMLGNVAEFANSNVFMAKDGVVFTPVPNGTFLNGITRQRVIELLRGDGVTVVESDRCAMPISRQPTKSSQPAISPRSLPITRIDDRALQPGPFYTQGAQALLGLCPRLSGNSGKVSSAEGARQGSGPVQHQFGVGQVGKARPMRAFEIFAAARFGKNAGETGEPARSHRQGLKSCRVGSGPGRWRRRIARSRRCRGNRSVASPAARSIRGGCASATG